MKIYRIATPYLFIDISMPTFLFWLFKKLAKVRTRKIEGFQGSSFDLIIFDEGVKKK